MARKRRAVRVDSGTSTKRRLRVWIKRADLKQPNSYHLLGYLKVWGYNMALGKEWVELREVRKGDEE